MAYTTQAEVASEFKNTSFTTTTNVTDTDVDAFIAEADALIDTHLGSRYVVPVTSSSPVSLKLVKLFSRTLVAARIRAIMEVQQYANKETNQNVRGNGTFGAKDVMDQLKAIRDDKQNLVDGIALQSGGGFSSYNVSNDISAVVKKDEKQW